MTTFYMYTVTVIQICHISTICPFHPLVELRHHPSTDKELHVLIDHDLVGVDDIRGVSDTLHAIAVLGICSLLDGGHICRCWYPFMHQWSF